ncbi:MAG TPA: helix-turn-helix transcriptional regulator [Steroidobacteraceae bacterium]|nr:helix-turn-helix transcriptional regulator [Steroidobacteraceae bacterium]
MLRPTRPVGELLREWRQRRRLSQLELSLDANVSARHLSFLETGRSQPSRAMLLQLTDALEVPLRERNEALIAAGFAPVYSQRSLDHPELDAARRAVDLVLSGHEPYPALAVDRHWTLLNANAAAQRLMTGVHEKLLEPPVNVLRMCLHPDGFAPRILNHAHIREHILTRLKRQIQATGDAVLSDLVGELSSYPPPPGAGAIAHDEYGGVLLPLRLQTPHGVLSLFGTITTFGTPVDVTLAELALEAFFPADTATAELLRRLAQG